MFEGGQEVDNPLVSFDGDNALYDIDDLSMKTR